MVEFSKINSSRVLWFICRCACVFFFFFNLSFVFSSYVCVLPQTVKRSLPVCLDCIYCSYRDTGRTNTHTHRLGRCRCENEPQSPVALLKHKQLPWQKWAGERTHETNCSGQQILCRIAEICCISECKQLNRSPYFTRWPPTGAASTNSDFSPVCSFPSIFILFYCLILYSLFSLFFPPLFPWFSIQFIRFPCFCFVTSIPPCFLLCQHIPSSLPPSFLTSFPFIILFCLTEVSVLERLARRWLRQASHICLQFPWEQLAVHSYLSPSIFPPEGIKLG